MLEEALSRHDRARKGGRMRHRILQHAGRRYSVKLDPAVWQALEGFAEEREMRLNALVAEVDRGRGNASLTEALRLYCLQRALERIGALSRRVEELALMRIGVPLGAIVDACPAPCLLVGHDQTIRRANAAAQRWMAATAEALVGRSLEHYLQIRATRPLSEIMAAFGRGEQAAQPVRVVYLRPGRVIMARATLCPASYDGPDAFSYLVMLDGAPS
jgi:predicted DNA-binding ribbon-helix-helix protein